MSEPDERLGTAHSGVAKDSGYLYPAHTSNREEHILDLRSLQFLGWVHQEIVNIEFSTLEITLGIGTGEPHPIGLRKRVLALL